MIELHPASARGQSRLGWLKSFHSFSFGDYYDPANMGFGPLRVINDDVIAGGGGFPMHPHRDMEIVTYVLSGALAHKDSLGSSGTIRPGEAQRMSAGRGIRHSEFNASPSDPVHLLQIWMLPERQGLEPAYEQRPLEPIDGRLGLIASRDGAGGSVKVNLDARLYATRLKPGETVRHAFAPGRIGYLHVATGSVAASGRSLEAGDALKLTGEPGLEIAGPASGPGEALLFDLPA